jgi:2'-5' RNA ligase
METELAQNKLFTVSPVNGFCEYLLVAHPDTTVNAQVMEEKQFFSAQYRDVAAIKARPHITVANFLAKEEMEATIIRWMHRIISSQKSFRVTLDQYGGFAQHTIYLRVQDHEPFQQLAKELKVVDQYVRSYGCPAMYMSNRPHITIARRLPDIVYREAIAEYQQKAFHASFDVKELVLLRRQHQFDVCKQVNVFGLTP